VDVIFFHSALACSLSYQSDFLYASQITRLVSSLSFCVIIPRTHLRQVGPGLRVAS
jgi:hypothetical protein